MLPGYAARGKGCDLTGKSSRDTSSTALLEEMRDWMG